MMMVFVFSSIVQACQIEVQSRAVLGQMDGGGGGLVWELGDCAYGGTIFVLTRSLSLHQRGEREGGMPFKGRQFSACRMQRSNISLISIS